MEKTRILVVEDESIVAIDIQKALQGLGYDVPIVVSSGEDAIKQAEETRPDLILMDIVIKGKMDGIQTAEEIRARFKIPIVFLTAYTDDEVIRKAKLIEPYGYIVKPFEDRELKTAVEIAVYKSKAEIQLKESQEWLSTTLRSIGDGVIAADAQGQIKFVNAIAESLTGWKQEDVIGRPLGDILDLVEERTHRKVDCPAAKVISEGATIQLTNKTCLISKDGSERIINFCASPIKDTKGKIAGVVMVFSDVTEHRRKEEKISRDLDIQGVISSILYFSLENLSLTDVLDYTLSRILDVKWLTFQKQGCIFLVDGESQELVMKAELGMPKEKIEACGRITFDKCVCSSNILLQKVRFFENIDDVCTVKLNEKTGYGLYCVPIVRAGNSLGLVNIYVEKGHRRSDEEEEFLKTVANVLAGIISYRQVEKDKENIQAQLLHTQKMDIVGKLTGGIIHDLNNLLVVIMGFSELAQEDDKNLKLTHDAFSEIIRAAKQSKTLVFQLLTLSRKNLVQQKVVDLNSLLTGLVKTLRYVIGPSIDLQTQFDEKLKHIKCDQGQLEQVVMNFIVNAKDAMPQGGKLFINTENVFIDENSAKSIKDGRAGEFVCFSIQDTGIGMNEEVKRKIFEPFFSTKAPGYGTGLGLSIVNDIVKQHFGWVNVESSPDHGTAFKVYLPATTAPLEQGVLEEISLKELRGNGERVLVVEDDKGVRNFEKTLLAENGYVVFDAGSSAEALDIFEKESGKFDILFADFVLPDENGIELADKILMAKKDICVLVSSGYAQYELLDPLLQEKKFAFLKKPYTIVEFLTFIKRACSRKNA